MKVALVSWDGSGPVQGLEGEPVTAAAPLRALEALRARRGFEPGSAAMPFIAAALDRSGADVAHAFTIADGAVAARSGIPAVLTFPWVPSRETVAARRGRLALLQEALAGCRVVAPDEATAAGLERWLGVRAPVAVTPEQLSEIYEEVAR